MNGGEFYSWEKKRVYAHKIRRGRNMAIHTVWVKKPSEYQTPVITDEGGKYMAAETETSRKLAGLEFEAMQLHTLAGAALDAIDIADADEAVDRAVLMLKLIRHKTDCLSDDTQAAIQTYFAELDGENT